jgi:signal transduction histidine kinase
MAAESAEAVHESKAAPAALHADALDLHSVVKSAQAISAETAFEALLARLMRIAIESAGAEAGALVLEGEGGPRVWAVRGAASASMASASETLPFAATLPAAGIPLEAAAGVPASIVHYVRRTGEPLVLAGAAIDDWLREGAEDGAHRPRSIACLPVQRQGRLSGVLYLDNGQVEGAFGPARLAVLGILAAQAAIALENARLVGGLQAEIEERRRAQERLGAALEEVERLKEDLEAENSQLRRDLIANVSHDLRTPLVSLRGYLELLAARGDGLAAAQRAECVAIALRQSEHMGRLIDELFELARLDFKGIALEREAFAAAELAADVLQKFRLAAEGRGVSLRIEAAPALPLVDADLGLIERVFENLVGNALQHTPAGGVVVLRLAHAAGGVQVEVSDSGAGIAAEDLPRIFDRFWQARRVRRGGGVGLGLAITQGIIQAHGGRIWARSTPGEGTRFFFTLPIVASDGRMLGHLAFRHRSPLGDEMLIDAVYRIFLARAAAELERLQALARLRAEPAEPAGAVS